MGRVKGSSLKTRGRAVGTVPWECWMAKSPKAIGATFSGAPICKCHLQVPPPMVPRSIHATSKCQLRLGLNPLVPPQVPPPAVPTSISAISKNSSFLGRSPCAPNSLKTSSLHVPPGSSMVAEPKPRGCSRSRKAGTGKGWCHPRQHLCHCHHSRAPGPLTGGGDLLVLSDEIPSARDPFS